MTTYENKEPLEGWQVPCRCNCRCCTTPEVTKNITPGIPTRTKNRCGCCPGECQRCEHDQ